MKIGRGQKFYFEGQWAKQGIGGSDTWGIATDAKGNVYLTGYFWDSIAFGANHLTSPNIDSYLVKYDSLGNILWATQSKAASKLSGAAAISAVTDNYGNSYLTGSFDDTVTFGPFTLKSLYYQANNGGDVFLTKYDSSGNVIWVKGANVPSTTSIGYANAVTTDNFGHVYESGVFIDTIVFGLDTLKTIIQGSVSTYLTKYSANGNVIWAWQTKNFSRKSYTNGSSIATDKDGNIFIAGLFRDTVIFGAYTLTTASQQGDIFIAKFDSIGNVLWAKQANLHSSAGSGSGYSVATDINGDAYITGYFIDTATFGTFSLISPTGDLYGDGEVFLAKYSPSGNVIWAKQSHHNSLTDPWYGWSVATDNINNVYLSAGNSSGGSGSVSFGRDTFLFSIASDPSLVLKLDSSGNTLCGTILTTGGDDFNTIAASPSGKYIYWGGDIATSIILGPDTLFVVSDEVPFVARWQSCINPSTGTAQVTQKAGNILVFPNPSTGLFTISCHAELVSASQTIEVYNMLEEKIYNATLNQVQADNTINISNQPNGIYLYRVISEDGNLIGEGKLIIQK